MINAGKYNKKIHIYNTTYTTDADGFQTQTRQLVLSTWANVKTTSGYTLIRSNTDFEQALTKFTIRYPSITKLNRDMTIDFNGKTYSIEYLNNINEANVEMEIQAKEITH